MILQVVGLRMGLVGLGGGGVNLKECGLGSLVILN